MTKEKRYKFLVDYGDVVYTALHDYKRKGGNLGDLADHLHLTPGRLSEFMRTGPRRRKLTFIYVFHFVKGGFISVDQFKQHKQNMTPEECSFFDDLKCFEDKAFLEIQKDKELMELLTKAKSGGKDVKPILRAFLS